jgi:RNA polymerase sigma factor (sigma-70 family)
MTAASGMQHSRAFELLPWLVNGTLGSPERDAVEDHVRTCIVCRREIKEQQRLHATVRARRTADVSAEAGFDRMSRELDEAARARQVWSKRSTALAPFAIAAAAGVAVLALLLWFTPLPGLESNAYSTLATASSSDAVLLDVVFAQNTTAAEMQALLDEALRHLSAEHRAVVELTYFYGCSYEEIAAIAACPVNTVKTRMFHARAKLKKLLPALGKDVL